MIIKPFCRKANFYETDQMGIIHHSNYIRWFEEARVDFMEQIGFPYSEVNRHGIEFGVLDVYCEYKSMVRFGDAVNIYTALTEIKNMKMAVDYRIVDVKTGELRTLGKTRHFFFDNTKKCLVSLKRAIPGLYELFFSLSQFQNRELVSK